MSTESFPQAGKTVVTMKKIGILYHPMVEATLAKAREVEDFLRTRGTPAWLCSAWDTEEARVRLNGTDLLLTVGGDGTILRAAQVAFTTGIPITGINLGRLGFMTEIDAAKAIKQLPAVLDDEGWLDERAMLQVEVCTGKTPRTFHALNDAVIARGEIVRVIRVTTEVDGAKMTTYKGDGVIVATATGSTGYAMAAGGPVLYPQSKDFMIVPVAPHLSTAHPVILPPDTLLKLTVGTVHPATVCIDGHISLTLSDGDSVTIKRSPNTIKFWRRRTAMSFFGSLEERLKGKRG